VSAPDQERPASSFEGVRYGAIARFEDPRGSFREIWREDMFGPIDPAQAGAASGSTARFVQANLSTSANGVLRGLHLHQRQLDHWVVASGRAFVALVDGGADRPLVETRELVADEWVDIPIGIAHGFLALEPLQLIYLVTNGYDGSDELGFAWDDPLADVPWPAVEGTPDGGPTLSERDRSNPSLIELVGRLRTKR